MIASYTTPSDLVQTVRPCKGTWILWSDGVMPWGMKFNTKKNVKLCPSPVGSHNLPICTTYQWRSQKLCVGAGPSTVKLCNSKCSAAQGSRLGGGSCPHCLPSWPHHCNLCGHILPSVQDSQVSWDHSYRWVVLVVVLSCTLDPQPCKLHPGLWRRKLRCCPAKLKETANITLGMVIFEVHIACCIASCADLYNVCIVPASYGATYWIWFRLLIPNPNPNSNPKP